MLKIDYTVFIQIINFLLLILVLNIVLYRPIRKILSQRKAEMGNLEATAADFQEKSARGTTQLEEGTAAARREGHKVRDGLRSEALELEKKLYQEAAVSSGERVQKASAERALALGQIRQSLEKEVDLFSRELAEKILGRSL